MEEHITVLLQPAVDALAIRPDGVYVDGTFGRGGHSRLILERLGQQGRLIAFDKDPQAIEVGKKIMEQDARFHLIHDGFVSFQAALKRLNIDEIDGALFDLGLSSPQLDEHGRGFSFRFDAPLDMRMDTTKGVTAAEWLNTADEKELTIAIRDYGEERFWKSIVANIVEQRKQKPLQTTFELAEICKRCVKKYEKGQNPATRTFQGVRIAINHELDEIQAVLPQVAGTLKTGGRLAVIAFHSLEDRIVKHFMKENATPPSLPRWVDVREHGCVPPLKIIGKAIRPDAEEIARNPRSRSAILRVAERTQGIWSS